jgi:diphthine synthase
MKNDPGRRMLTIVGLGLCDGNDITLRGLAAVKAADAVYLESYTSLLQCTHEQLEAQLGVRITKLVRTDIESGIDRVLDEAATGDVVMLVIGDPFGATTHTDLYLRAVARDISVSVVHNATIMSAVGATGLELYRFGKTVSIPYWSPGFEPTSFLNGILDNHARGLHTLCLLDIKADEERFMSVREGIEHLRAASDKLTREATADAQTTAAARALVTDAALITDGLLVVGCARIGCPDAMICADRLDVVSHVEFGAPPHCMIIPGKLHHIEEEMLARWKA